MYSECVGSKQSDLGHDVIFCLVLLKAEVTDRKEAAVGIFFFFKYFLQRERISHCLVPLATCACCVTSGQTLTNNSPEACNSVCIEKILRYSKEQAVRKHLEQSLQV